MSAADEDEMTGGKNGANSNGSDDLDFLDDFVDKGAQAPKARKAVFDDVGGGGGKSLADSVPNMSLLLDVPMRLTVELGRTTRSIKDVLELNVGSVLELDKLSGEPVDLLVNGKVIARAEVVVIDENFGVRVTEIVIPKEKLILET